jgi:hypothetical protein
MVAKTIRFEDDDWPAIEKAAALEGIDPTSYMRRCVITYTREHHPDAFGKKKRPSPD